MMNERGYIILMSVLVVGAIALSINIALLTFGITNTHDSRVNGKLVRARGLAYACADEALEKLRESVFYTGNETLALGDGTCTIASISGTGNVNRTLMVTGIVESTETKIKIVIATVHPSPNITSWKEVSSF